MDLSQVNLTDADLFQRGTPHDMFRVLRREAPVYRHPEPNGPGFWAVTKYHDLKWVSKNPGLFSSERQGTLREDPAPTDLPAIQSIMLNMDPPRHRQYRTLVNQAFTPRMINNLHGRVRAMVTKIINGVIERGECDFVEDVAALLPLEVICEMMGVPEEDRRHIYVLGNKMVGIDDPDLQSDGKPIVPGDAMAAFGEMFVYASNLWKIAHETDKDTLARALVNAELEGRKLDEMEFNFFFLLLLIAGNETTRTVTSNGMIELLAHRSQLRDLENDPTLVPSAVEEILRFAPAVHTFRRTATADVELRGQMIRADEKLLLWYPSANRDEDVFREPDTFDIRRSPNDHVAFGFGEHYCLGANLARMELQEVFRGITMRFRDMEHAAPPRRLRSTFINGVKEMLVTFTPGPLQPVEG
ncbi:MAG: cytochrome P450 [Deltaproteobacteria bacterium]|nr:cytochrome P450 [Deltaproteobacteria bacterium]